MDARSGQIVAVTLTDQDVNDESQVGPLLEQIESLIEQVTADGAYDGEPTYQMIATHDAVIAVVIPPQDNAVPSAGFETDPSPRDTQSLASALRCSRCRPETLTLLQLDLDAVGQHVDVADLVGLPAEAHLLGREGAKNLAAQQACALSHT